MNYRLELMKSEKYRLRTVLEIRIRAKDEAAKLVAFCLQQLEKAEEELNRRQENLQMCRKKQNQSSELLNKEMNKGLKAHNILKHRNFLDDLRNLEIELISEVEKQQSVVAKAEKDLQIARENLLESARELKAIETHKTNWQIAEQSEKNRREQKISDEIGAIIHNQRKSQKK